MNRCVSLPVNDSGHTSCTEYACDQLRHDANIPSLTSAPTGLRSVLDEIVFNLISLSTLVSLNIFWNLTVIL